MGDHTEAFALDFDPSVISYGDLLAEFWASHRATRPSYSRQYMAAAFPSARQLDAARASRPANAETPVVPDARFYLAEDYHQKYYLRHDRTLMAELAHYTPAAFTDSTAAARLNAYVAGHGTLAQLDAERDALLLSDAAMKYLRSRVGGRRVSCG
jgi:peptide-methionine (S)-S-oxide reductase